MIRARQGSHDVIAIRYVGRHSDHRRLSFVNDDAALRQQSDPLAVLGLKPADHPWTGALAANDLGEDALPFGHFFVGNEVQERPADHLRL